MAALQSSSAGYDAGNFWEAARLATIVYTLVNDGRSRTVSILSQLGLRDQLEFLTHTEQNTPGNLIGWAPLCTIELAQEYCRYMPMLDRLAVERSKKVKFKTWWSEPIFENSYGQPLSRMNLVFALRSQDGGSHFDSELPQSPYLNLKNDAQGLQFIKYDGSPPVPIRNAHTATMRQIAFELEQSIRPVVDSI